MTALCEPETTNPEAVMQAILLQERDTFMKAIAPTRIVLTGFMGAGKSTIGRMLAKRLGWRFFDVDEVIVTKAGVSVAEVFAQSGEFVFRRMETAAIAHLLGEHEAVLALGGGAVEVLANRLLLEQTPATVVAFLEAPLATLLARCDGQVNAAVRPNLAAAEERFRYRAPLYRRVGQVCIPTEHQTPDETTEALLRATGAGFR